MDPAFQVHSLNFTSYLILINDHPEFKGKFPFFNLDLKFSIYFFCRSLRYGPQDFL